MSPGIARAVLLLLQACPGGTGRVVLQQIARRAGVSVSNLRLRLEYLRLLGWLDVRGGGRGGSHVTIIRRDALEFEAREAAQRGGRP